jgi:myosin heavy subunit
MNSLGFNKNFQDSIWASLAAILHLGNIEFAASKGSDNGSTVVQPQECMKIANMLGIPSPELLERALCFRESTVGSETIVIAVEPKKALDQRDAVAKYIYGKIFDKIVSVVNTSLFRGKHGNNIGVLDIFGFEVFKFNSFEQLCINYCNERLQSFFNDVIFEEELKLYAADGVSCDEVAYQDNLGCVRLIDLKGAGIFSFLDEEILLPKGSDEKFVNKLHQVFDESANTKSTYYGRNRKEPAEFIVRHFAGDVTYNSQNFMEKNKDAIAPGLLKLVNQSSISFLQPPADDKAASPDKRAPASSRMTLAAKFKLDLDQLLTQLKSTKPHFIRCVKPNDQQKADNFDSMLTLNQLKYSGLFEAIRIRKAGYSIRIPHDQFIQNFKHCLNVKLPAEIKKDTIQYCQRLLMYLAPQVDFSISSASLSKHPEKRRSSVSRRPSTDMIRHAPSNATQNVSQWCVGNSRVYIRTTLYKYHLDLVRAKSVGNLLPVIQKLVRGFIARMKVRKLFGIDKLMKEKAKKFEAEERELMAHEDSESQHYENMIKNDKELQNRILEAKKARVKAEYDRKIKILNKSVVLIQKIVRGASQRRSGKLHMCENLFRRAIDSRNFNKLRTALAYPSKAGIFLYANHKNIKKWRNTYKVADIGCGLYLTVIVNSLNVIKVYTDRARQLIADLINEAYIANELSEAIVCQNITILKDAITLAKDQNLKHLPKYKDAVIMLNERLKVRDILTQLSEEICHCVSIPELLNRHDAIQTLLRQSMNLGLAAESIVIDTVRRVKNIELLVEVRNEIRKAFELCSVSRMAAALERRLPYVEMYGENLMLPEVQAVLAIRRMLKFEKIVEKTSTQKTSSELDVTQAESKDESSEGDNSPNNSDDIDVGLPPFVKVALDNLRGSNSVEVFNHNVQRLFVLVPDNAARKKYIRIYKWIVGNAFWAYPKRSTKATSSVGGDERTLKEDL